MATGSAIGLSSEARENSDREATSEYYDYYVHKGKIFAANETRVTYLFLK